MPPPNGRTYLKQHFLEKYGMTQNDKWFDTKAARIMRQEVCLEECHLNLQSYIRKISHSVGGNKKRQDEMVKYLKKLIEDRIIDLKKARDEK